MSWFSRKNKPDASGPDVGEVMADLQRVTASIKAQADTIKRERGQAYVGLISCSTCGDVGMFATAKNEPQMLSCPKCQRPIRISNLQPWG